MLLLLFTGTFIATPLPEKKIAYKNFFALKERLAIIGRLPCFVALSDGLKIMETGFITCDDIGKLLFVIFWKHLKRLFGHFNPLPLLLIRQHMWYLAEIFLAFKCFFKIKRTVDSDMPTFREILRAVNLASPSMISFILETISIRDADFGLPDFGAFFHELYTRLIFLSPSPNCVIRYTRRSISSRKFSHQLLQRTTKF